MVEENDEEEKRCSIDGYEGMDDMAIDEDDDQDVSPASPDQPEHQAPLLKGHHGSPSASGQESLAGPSSAGALKKFQKKEMTSAAVASSKMPTVTRSQSGHLPTPVRSPPDGPCGNTSTENHTDHDLSPVCYCSCPVSLKFDVYLPFHTRIFPI